MFPFVKKLPTYHLAALIIITSKKLRHRRLLSMFIVHISMFSKAFAKKLWQVTGVKQFEKNTKLTRI